MSRGGARVGAGRKPVYIDTITRISLRLPNQLLNRLDEYAQKNNLDNRTKALFDLLNKAEAFIQHQKDIEVVKALKEEIKGHRRKINVLPTVKEWFENLPEEDQEMLMANYKKKNNDAKPWTKKFMGFLQAERDRKLIQGRFFD